MSVCRRILFHAFLALTLVLSLTACDNSEEPLVLTSFELNAPKADSPGSTLRDADGLYDLQGFPAYVQVTLSGPDFEAMVQEWPATAAEFTPGPTVLDFEFDVAAGDDRSLDAVAFLFDDGRPYVFVPAQEELFDLASGTTTDVTLELVEAETGTLSGTASLDVVTILLIDTATDVRLATAVPGVHGYEFGAVPFGRTLRVAWLDDSDVLHPVETPLFLDAEAPDATLDIE